MTTPEPTTGELARTMEYIRSDVAKGFGRVEKAIEHLTVTTVPREVFEARLQLHVERIEAVEADVSDLRSVNLARRATRRFTVTTWVAVGGLLTGVGGVIAGLATHF